MKKYTIRSALKNTVTNFGSSEYLKEAKGELLKY